MKKTVMAIILALIFAIGLLSGPAAGHGLAGPSKSISLKGPMPPTWIDARQANGIVYFLFADSPRIERFDLPTAAWLPAIPLSANPTHLEVDQSRIFVGYGNSITRYNLDGSSPTGFGALPGSIKDMSLLDEYLIVFYEEYGIDSDTRSYNKQTGALVDQELLYYKPLYTEAAPEKGKVIGSGSTYSGFAALALNSDGTFGGYQFMDNGVYLGGPYINVVSVISNQRRMVDLSGAVYNLDDLSHDWTIRQGIQQAADYGEQLVVLYKGGLAGYNSRFEQVGQYFPFHPVQRFAIWDDTIYTFFGRTTGIQVTAVPASLINVTKDEPAAVLNDFKVWPEAAFSDGEGTVFVLSPKNLAIYRWSVPQRAYLEPIPLQGSPSHISYQAATNRIFLAYEGGIVNQIRLNDSLAEQPFVSVLDDIVGLTAMEDKVLVVTNWGWNYSIYNLEGSLLATADGRDRALEYVWNETYHSLYHIQLNDSWNFYTEQIQDDGQVGSAVQSQYDHYGDPIRVSPDGSILMIAGANIVDGSTGLKLRNLPATFCEATWSNGVLYTLHAEDGAFRLDQWDAGLENRSSYPDLFYGDPIFLLPVEDGVLVVTSKGGSISYELISSDLTLVYRQKTYSSSLPFAAKKIAGSDDFSNPNSGWPVGENEFFSYGYRDGEYSIKAKVGGYLYAVLAPVPRSERYMVEIQGDFPEQRGFGYGVIFDMIGNYDRYNLFYIGAAGSDCALYSFDGTEYHGGGMTCDPYTLAGPDLMTLTRGDSFYGLVNHYEIFDTDSLPEYAYPSRFGVFSLTHSFDLHSDARFDNFRYEILRGVVPFPDLFTLSQMKPAGQESSPEILVLPAPPFLEAANQ